MPGPLPPAALVAGLKKLRENEHHQPGVCTLVNAAECSALLDALDLLCRVREGIANDPSGGGPSVSSEDWALINEAADAVENSR